MDAISIGSTFVDYFFEADNAFLEKYKLKPEDDIFFGDRKGLTFKKLTSELPPLEKSPGGMSTNTAAVLSALGIKSAYYGVVGNDAISKFWKSNLPQVNKSHIIEKGKTSICACVLNNSRKNRLFISNMNKADNTFFKKIDFRFLNKAKIVHISPYVLNHEQTIPILEKVLNKIHKPSKSFTPSLLGALLGLEKMKGILNNIDILFINKDELKIMTNKNPKVGSKFLLNYGPKIIVCTLGAKGALTTTKDLQFLTKSYKVGRIVDSTGSGDAFAAGFLYGILKGKNLKWSARFGSKIASKSLTGFGLSWVNKLKVRL